MENKNISESIGVLKVLEVKKVKLSLDLLNFCKDIMEKKIIDKKIILRGYSELYNSVNNVNRVMSRLRSEERRDNLKSFCDNNKVKVEDILKISEMIEEKIEGEKICKYV